MKTIVKTQEELNLLIKTTPSINNINFDENGNLKLVDFSKEYIEIEENGNTTLLTRIPINKVNTNTYDKMSTREKMAHDYLCGVINANDNILTLNFDKVIPKCFEVADKFIKHLANEQ